MNKALLVCTIAGLAGGCASQQQSAMGAHNAVQTGTASAETSFAHQACQSAATEVELGQLAALNTRNKEIQMFAKSMAADYKRAGEELDRLFVLKGIPEEARLENFQSSVDQLVPLKGGQFDRAFKDQVIEGHEKAIAEFERQAREGTDPDLRAFAEKHLPELREHLEIARNLPISSGKKGPPAEGNFNTVQSNPAVRGIPFSAR